MPQWVVCLRGLSFGALAVRLILAMLVGGLLGMERIRKHRPAGIRTYMLVCLGAAMTMILGQYQEQMMATVWKEAVLASGARLDPSRYSAQVISGIGFLGAGTVLVTGKQEVKGLTTAAGLWAAACIGIGIGAGFYECAVLAVLLVYLCNVVLPRLESVIVENARNMNITIEFDSLEHVKQILVCLKDWSSQIYEIELDPEGRGAYPYHRADISLRLKQRKSHARLILSVSELPCVRNVNEI